MGRTVRVAAGELVRARRQGARVGNGAHRADQYRPFRLPDHLKSRALSGAAPNVCKRLHWLVPLSSPIFGPGAPFIRSSSSSSLSFGLSRRPKVAVHDHGSSLVHTRSLLLLMSCTDHSVAAERLLVDRKSTRLNSSHLGISYAVF